MIVVLIENWKKAQELDLFEFIIRTFKLLLVIVPYYKLTIWLGRSYILIFPNNGPCAKCWFPWKRFKMCTKISEQLCMLFSFAASMLLIILKLLFYWELHNCHLLQTVPEFGLVFEVIKPTTVILLPIVLFI